MDAVVWLLIALKWLGFTCLGLVLLAAVWGLGEMCWNLLTGKNLVSGGDETRRSL